MSFGGRLMFLGVKVCSLAIPQIMVNLFQPTPSCKEITVENFANNAT